MLITYNIKTEGHTLTPPIPSNLIYKYEEISKHSQTINLQSTLSIYHSFHGVIPLHCQKTIISYLIHTNNHLFEQRTQNGDKLVRSRQGSRKIK